ncbi:MAG: glutaredoxin family protein [Betaproteobacteria bacterium]|nr:glutaredoxin family protein [Betaproteobacteria bacterium]
MILRAFLLLSVFSLMLIALAVPAQAQQYRWVDKDGKVRFTDTPPPPGAKDVRKSDAVAPASEPAPLPYALGELQKNFPVTLYTSPVCKEFCAMAREALNKRGVPFKEVQVWNVETLEELKQTAGSDTVPVLVVGRSAQSGFDQVRYDALLDSAGYPAVGVFAPRSQAAPPLPEGYEPPPVAEPAAPAAPAAPAQPPGPYDPSGLKGPEPKPGIYDPSGLKGPEPKPGPYGTPPERK